MDDNSEKLRAKAKEELRQGKIIDTSLYETDMKVLVEELSIYQIELEHQNQELILSQDHLQQSNDRYLDLFDNAPIGYLIVDISGVIKDINQTAAKLLERSKSEFVDTKITRFIHPDYQDIYYHYFQSLTNLRHQQPCDIKLRKANNSFFYGRIQGVCQTKKVDHEAEFRLAISDISSQKEMEIKLLAAKALTEQSEERYRLLADNVPDIIYSLNGEGNIMTINNSAFIRYGYTENDATGKPFLSFVYPDDRDTVLNSFYQALQEQRNYTHGLQFRIAAKNGEVHWLELNSKASFDNNGAYLGEDGVLRDITDRRIAEEALHQSEEKFREMANLLPQIIFESDNTGCLTYVNKNAFSILGYPEDYPIKGKNSLDFYTPESRNRALENINKSITGNQRVFSNEYEMIKSDGTTFPVLIYSNPIIKNGVHIGLRGIIVNIAEQKQIEQELRKAKEQAEESDRLKSSFLANMSHEIRTPLNGILGFASLIYDDEPDTETARYYADIIGRNGDRLLSLINKILDISKIESGNMPVENTSFSPHLLIKEVKELFQVMANKHDVNIITQTSPELTNITIIADKSKLTQILTNLLSNALKFTKNGLVEIRYYREENHIVFSVKDNGLGISEEGQKHLFERFYQVNTNSKYNAEGSGLGLSLCKALVELLNGRIWIESKAGEGACFSFSIPCEFMDDENSTSIDWPNQSVLLVEDDFKQAQLIKVLLEKYNLQVVYAKNGADAIQLIRQNNSLSMILMDINMPVLNGLETTREIRKNNIYIPIIAITGFSNECTQHDVIQLGFNDYLVKPLTSSGISKIINKFITV